MAHTLTLSISGEITVDITQTGWVLTEYIPRSGTEGERFVTESVEVFVKESTVSDLLDSIRSFEQFFARARRYHRTRFGPRPYVNFSMDSDSETWRSEIIDGQIIVDDTALKEWANTSVILTASWQRKAYWEGSETDITISNSNTTDTTTGVTIQNHRADPTNQNWVHFLGTEITGSLETPLIVQIENLETSLSPRSVYIGLDQFHIPGSDSFFPVLEGEDEAGALSPTVDAGSSGGNYQRVSWTTSTDHTTERIYWSLQGTLQEQYGGAWVRVLMRCANAPPSDCYAKVWLKIDDTSRTVDVFEGAEVLLNSAGGIQDLGAIKIPPGYVTGTPTDAALVLTFRNGTTADVDIDFLFFCGPNGVWQIEQLGASLGQNDSIVADGIDEWVYALENTSGDKYDIFNEYTRPIMVSPGVEGEVHVLFDEGATMDISLETKVYLKYRPRKMVL